MGQLLRGGFPNREMVQNAAQTPIQGSLGLGTQAIEDEMQILEPWV